MKAVFAMVTCLVWSLWAGAATYQWTDERGNTVYSDHPVPGARQVPVQPAAGAGSPYSPPVEATKGAPPAEAAVPAYTALRIVSPAPDETIHDNTGTVNVVLALEPPPGPEAKLSIRVYLDGAPLPELQTTASFALHDLDRGSHTLQVEALGPRGEVLATSGSTSFQLWQASGIFQNPATTFPKAPTAPTAPAAPRAP